MILNVRKAETAESQFAWPLYETFVRENLFNDAPNKASSENWDHGRELDRFSSYWSETEPYIVEVDDKKVGWLSMSRSADELTVENVFIVGEWQKKGIVSRFFKEMTPQWRKENLKVNVTLLKDAPRAPELQKMLKNLGYRPVEFNSFNKEGDLTQVMQAQ